MTKLDEIPVAWDAAGEGDILEPGAVSYVRFLGQKLFDEYEPLQFLSFETQLLDWLNNLDDDTDRKVLLSLLSDLFYVGRNEYSALYRSAYNGLISTWIIDICKLELFSQDIDERIRSHLNQCWICPITDSLRINAFLKTNNLISQSVRPDWLSLKQLGDVEKIKIYLRENKIENLILIEDFVGSGTQAKGVLKFVGTEFPELNVLFLPLIICPKGDEELENMTSEFGNIRYAPMLILPESCILSVEAIEGEPLHHAAARVLFAKISSRFALPAYETMYGFKSTGSQVVLHSNCPNNTLQVYHHEGADWVPLFPRVRRVK